MPSLGEAYIEVHADTGPFDRELAASVEKALIAAEAQMRAKGRDAGNAFGEGVETAISDHVKRIGDNMSDGLTKSAERAGKEVAKELASKINDAFDADLGANFAIKIPISVNEGDKKSIERDLRSWARRISQFFATTFSGAGNLINSFSSMVSQLNRFSFLLNPVSLAAIFGILGGAILGLVHLLNPITALIVALPAAIGGLALQATIIAAAFNGIGNSIAKIFGADTLGKALEVTEKFQGGIRNFLVGVAYFSQVWRDIVTIVQASFFRPFDNSLRLLSQLLSSGEMLAGIRNLAFAMGSFANAVIKTFASKAFTTMLSGLLNTMATIVNTLSGPFLTLMTGLFNMINASLPFLQGLADMLGGTFTKVGNWLTKISTNGQLDSFLDDTIASLKELGDLLAAAFQFIGVIMTVLRESGVGDNFIRTITEVLKGFSEILSSELGQKAITSMVEAAMGAIVLIGGIIVALGIVWLAIVAVAEAVKFLIGAIVDFFVFLFTKISDFFIWLAGGVAEGKQKFLMAWAATFNAIRTGWNTAYNFVADKIKAVVAFVQGIPDRVENAFVAFGNLLYNAGADLINGLISGIKSAIPGLESTLDWITDHIPSWKGPEDVDKRILYGAGVSVMDGFREGLAAGAAGVMGDLGAISSMMGVNANANSFNFGPGSIVQNFNGAQPTSAAAQSLGSAAGAGIAGTVNAQTTRSSVRAM